MIMSFKKIFTPIICGFFAVLFAACGTKSSSVAVVVDRDTYDKIGAAVDKYVEAIALSDRKGVLVVDRWQHPDSIKAELKRMYDNDCLEGAVFIGEIPIAMVRDAQHMATAFKRSQKDNWLVSSIPSDRFYDDFDLKFNYLKQDSVKTLAHYYSLAADSPQIISSDIYSARIKAPFDGKSCHNGHTCSSSELCSTHSYIEAYLLKAVEAHKSQKRMDKVLHFGAHGYNSESLQARIDEAIGFKEQFPFLNGYDGELSYIDFNRDYLVKKRIMNAVADSDVDYA
ncbi:MAG: HEAT repeat domain-containing protein, partial [Bacteroidales bacterium]|nr:HEAT repeat domain-containing protein [Bacteroidales bacterium]